MGAYPHLPINLSVFFSIRMSGEESTHRISLVDNSRHPQSETNMSANEEKENVQPDWAGDGHPKERRLLDLKARRDGKQHWREDRRHPFTCWEVRWQGLREGCTTNWWRR